MDMPEFASIQAEVNGSDSEEKFVCVSQKADMLMDPRGARGLLSNWTDSGPHCPNYQLLL